MEYTQVSFAIQDPGLQEMLAALLTDVGYEGFEFQSETMEAFIPTPQFDEATLKDLMGSFSGFKNTGFTSGVIPETNWNELWEKGYSPLRIGNDLYVRASFHPPDPSARYELIIDPKMSFGTGHHETTHMMSEMLLAQSPAGCSVLDFGSGTGILAILAAKMGAKEVLAIDHEEWAYNNCLENIALNHVPSVTVIHGDEQAIPSRTFDIILANVNKNIIMSTIARLSEAVKPDGFIYLSGLLQDDEAAVLKEASTHGLRFSGKRSGNSWICLKLIKAA